MGARTSKSNTGAVQNEIQIYNAELSNQDIIILLYIIALVGLANLTLNLYKMWKRSLKRKYMQRTMSTDKI